MIGVFCYILLCRLNGYEYLVIRYLCDVVVVDFFLFSIAEIVMCILVLCPVKCFGKIGFVQIKKERQTLSLSYLVVRRGFEPLISRMKILRPNQLDERTIFSSNYSLENLSFAGAKLLTFFESTK